MYQLSIPGPRHPKRRARATAALVALGAALPVLLGGAWQARAALQDGGPGFDVLIGRDNDNAGNTFIQPPGVAAKQHLDNTDILRASGRADLLIGHLGDDVLVGAGRDDILVGGPEAFSAPNSDVMLAGAGDDINIWAPGDGSDAFVGDRGYDTMVLAPFVLEENGLPELVRFRNRMVPQVTIDNQPNFRCAVEAVPADQNLGFEFLVRFFANDNLAVTVRQQDVEQVLCTSPNRGTVQVADLTRPDPSFVERPLNHFSDTTLGAIIQAP